MLQAKALSPPSRQINTLLLLEVKSSLKTIDSKIDNLTPCLDRVKQRVDSHDARLVQLAARVSDAKDAGVSSAQTRLKMDKILKLIHANNVDLKARC